MFENAPATYALKHERPHPVSRNKEASKPDQVGKLHEELPGVVEKRLAAKDRVPRRRAKQIVVLVIAGVTSVEGGSGIHKVDQQEIGVDVLDGSEGCARGLRKGPWTRKEA